MYRSAALRVPRDAPPIPPAPPAAAEAPRAGDPMPYEAAATLACRTPVGAETSGADGKAAGLLSLLGLMFAILSRFGPELGAALRGGGTPRAACGALLLGFSACALFAVVQAFRTISPRFCKAAPSLAFFGEVARLAPDEYYRRVEAMDMRQAVEQIVAYNHTAATICAEKFRQLRRALRCFEIAAACWLALAVLLAAMSLRGG